MCQEEAYRRCLVTGGKVKQCFKKEFRVGSTDKCGNHLHRCDNQSHDFG